MKHLLLIFIALFSLQAFAGVFKVDPNGNYVFIKSEFKITELLDEYAKHNNLNINILTNIISDPFTIQGNMIIAKDKIDSYVSSVFNSCGYMIIRLKDPDQITVINSIDLKYATLPMYTNLSEVPDNEEPVQFKYIAKYYDSKQLAVSLRPFMSKRGIIKGIESSNTLHISETGKNIKRLSRIIEFMDNEDSVKSKKEVDQLNEKYKKLLKDDKGVLDVFIKNSGLLMVVFMLLGLIIGFGSRGYMMKKVEGGW